MGFVCGKTGSGKGMAVKIEMTGTILSNPTDEIYIIDRAGEYTGISSRYGGVTYNFAVDSDTYLNPFDTVSVESLSPDAQLAFKIDAMLAQAGASAAEAGRDLGEEDQSIITRCVQEAFFDARQRGEQPPLLEDFYNKLLEQPEPEAKTIALRYERFVTGAQSFFNHQSNVDFKSRIVDFNLKDLPDSMLVFGLINVCEAVRNRMYFNAKRGVRTWLYVEEMQSMFAYPTVLNYFSRFSNVLYASNATICYGCVLTASVCATWIRRNKKLWSIFLQELLSDMSCRRNYSFCNGTFPKPAFRL